MALSNGSYDGGLVIYGRSSTTNQFFTIPLPYTSGSVNEATVELNQGSWTFAAVAWDGDSDVFEGTALCALQSVNLNSNEQTVTLNLSAATCDDPSFGSNTTSSNFKDFALVTCGSLYVDQSPLTLLSSDTPGFCTSANLDPDLRVHAKAVKISIPIQIPGTAFNPNSPLTRCVDLTNGSQSTVMRLPAKGLPLTFELLESSCADTPEKKLVTYPLQFGMDHPYMIFDRQYFTTNTHSRLYLAASLSRRGTSPFMASLPSFKCDTVNPCIKVPTTTSHRYITSSNEIFVKQKANGESCSNLSLTNNLKMNSTIVSGSITSNDCRENDGKFYLRLNNTIYGACTTTSCNLQFDFKNDDTHFSLSVTKQGAYPAQEAYDLIFRTLGHEDFTSSPGTSTTNAMNSLSAFFDMGGDDEKKNFGELSDAREFLRPDTIGGFLTTLSLTQMSNYDLTIQVWDEGIQRPYHISIVADTGLVPPFMADDDDLTLVSNTTRTYSHRITLSRIVGGAYFPQMVLKFINGEQVGELENYHTDIDFTNDRRRIERSRIFWNTQVPSYGRFEKYRYEKEVQNSDSTNVLNLRTSFVRAEREPTTSQGNARIVRYDYDSRKNGNTYDERASKSMVILKDNRAIYKQSSAELNNAALWDMFTTSIFKNYVKAINITSKSAAAVSPNGTKTISAWAEFDGTGWDLKVVVKHSDSAPQFFTFPVNSSQGFVPRVTINNGGQATVAWIEKYGSSYQLYAMVKTGPNWVDTGNSPVSNNSTPTNIAWNSISSPFGFEIMDLNLASTTTSDKILFFTDTGNLVKMSYTAANASLWGPKSSPLGSIGGTVLELRGNNIGPTYYISYLKATGTTLSHAIGTVRTDLSTNTLSNPSMFTGTSPRLETYASGTQIQLLVIDGNLPMRVGFLDTTQTNFASSGLGTVSPLANTVYRYHEPNTYCFARNMTSAQVMGDTPQTTGCVLPNTSYSFPIRSEFKFNIESLHPSNISSIFSLN